MELLTGFLRRLVAERARADYDALVDSFATGLCAAAAAGLPCRLLLVVERHNYEQQCDC